MKTLPFFAVLPFSVVQFLSLVITLAAHGAEVRKVHRLISFNHNAISCREIYFREDFCQFNELNSDELIPGLWRVSLFYQGGDGDRINALAEKSDWALWGTITVRVVEPGKYQIRVVFDAFPRDAFENTVQYPAVITPMGPSECPLCSVN